MLAVAEPYQVDVEPRHELPEQVAELGRVVRQSPKLLVE
jgi:hypothetical protein